MGISIPRGFLRKKVLAEANKENMRALFGWIRILNTVCSYLFWPYPLGGGSAIYI